MKQNANARPGILSLRIKDIDVLYATYMPFLEHGGLFIPTSKSYPLGCEVFMLLSIMDEAEQIPVAGTVVWLAPANSLGSRAQGIGVQFNDEDSPAKGVIERRLAAMLNSDKPTHTM